MLKITQKKADLERRDPNSRQGLVINSSKGV
jgi:hypothetical protein